MEKRSAVLSAKICISLALSLLLAPCAPCIATAKKTQATTAKAPQPKAPKAAATDAAQESSSGSGDLSGLESLKPLTPISATPPATAPPAKGDAPPKGSSLPAPSPAPPARPDNGLRISRPGAGVSRPGEYIVPQGVPQGVPQWVPQWNYGSPPAPSPAPPPQAIYPPGTGYYPQKNPPPAGSYPPPGLYGSGAYPPAGYSGNPPVDAYSPGTGYAPGAGYTPGTGFGPNVGTAGTRAAPPSAAASSGGAHPPVKSPKPSTNSQGTLPPPSPPPAGTPSSIAPSANVKPGATPSAGPFVKQPAQAPSGPDSYPQIGEMETITFGTPSPGLPVEQRLTQLENAIFKQAYTDQTLFDRTDRLKQTLLGGGVEARQEPDPAFDSAAAQEPPVLSYFDEIAQRPENQAEASKEDLAQFAIDLINFERGKYGLDIMSSDSLATQLSVDHARDLIERRVVSHQNRQGDNPDQRYTKAGGLDAISESLVSLKTADIGSEKLNRAVVAKILKVMMNRQDDREALLSPDAGNIGFAIERSKSRDRIIACTDVVTKHGIMNPLPLEVHVGDKVDIKGVVLSPYKFERVTLAWEGLHSGPEPVDEDSDEALPYFPPLDYVAYATKAERDHSKAVGTLKMIGIVAAIAGGVFMPPVALAAPLIAMTGSSSEPKPMSDIPVHGGFKVEGSTFSGKVPISNSGKEGLYYITVWASSASSPKPVPISRRAITVSSTVANNSSDSSKSDDKDEPNNGSDKKSDDSKSDDDKKSKSKDRRKDASNDASKDNSSL